MASASAEGMDNQTVCDLLATGHAHLEARVRALAALLESGDRQASSEATASLELALGAHMREEEEKLFPILASRLLMVRPVSVLAREHRRIAAQLGDLHEAVEEGRLIEARRFADDLLALVEAHHQREIEGLFSWADILLGPDGREQLIRTLVVA
jgi:hypothetical protein